MKKRVAILGASGYTGAELLRLLLQHPHVEIKYLTADSQAGKPMRDVYPHLDFAGLPDLVGLDTVDYGAVDIAFACLPHGATQKVVAAIPKHVKVIDLSADFRLGDTATYAQWYGHEHYAPELQKEAVYGLTELNRDAIRSARLIANPGCYPTSAQLPLMPLLEQHAIEIENIIIDSKSGVTGAGRAAKQGTLFTEVNDGLNAYSIGAHRHAPEIEQGLSFAANKKVLVSFTPHLIPMNRGILSTIYVTLAKGKTVNDLSAILKRVYAKEPFVKLVSPGITPSTHMVRSTNLCVMGAFKDRLPNRAIIVSVIDNLVKGASGQAVQNMNLVCGLPETTALTHTAIFP